MATSGTMQGNSVSIGGNGSNYYFINWQVASQNTAGNYSTINWQCYFHYNSADAQLDVGRATLGGADRYNNGGRVYNYAGNFTTRDMAITSGSFNLGHNPDGTQSMNVNGTMTAYNSGTSSGSQTWTLPTIPRYAVITSFTQTPVTDEEIQINWNADNICDYISWWSTALDGGGHHDESVTPSAGTFVKTFHNLVSNKSYDFTVAVRRQDSGLWTTSSTANPMTLSQNGYFNTMGL